MKFVQQQQIQPNQNAIEYAYTKKEDTKEVHPDTKNEMCNGSTRPFHMTNAKTTSSNLCDDKLC